MVRGKTIPRKTMKTAKPTGAGESAAETPSTGPIDRKQAFEAALNELRNNVDQYLRAPDLATAIKQLLGKIGVNMSEAQAERLFSAIGASGNLRPGDTEALRSVLQNAMTLMPRGTGAPNLQDLLGKVNRK